MIVTLFARIPHPPLWGTLSPGEGIRWVDVVIDPYDLKFKLLEKLGFIEPCIYTDV